MRSAEQNIEAGTAITPLTLHTWIGV